MSTLLYIIYTIILIIGSCKNKLINTNIFSYYDYDSEKIQFVIGSSLQTIQATMDLNAKSTWLFKNQLKNYTSDNLRIINSNMSISFESYNQSLNADYIEDMFYLNGNKHNAILFSFFLIDQEPPSYHGQRSALAFPFKFDNERNSIVHIYKSKGFIDHLSFGLKRDTREKILRIGGLAEEDKYNKTHSYFDVIGKKDRWDFTVTCGIIQVGPESKVFKTDRYTNYGYLDTTDEIMTVPTSFFDLIIAFYNKSIESRLCQIYTFKNGRRQLNCLNINSLSIGKVVIEIGNYQYNLHISDLWICETVDDCEFVIMDDPVNNHWKLGTKFYHKTNVLFDYEDRKVHFYKTRSGDIKTIKGIIRQGTFKDFNIIVCFVIGLLVFGIIFMFVIKSIFKI